MHLIGEEGLLKGEVIEFPEGTEWILGRDSETAALVLHDETVSRKHARFFKTEDGICLEDFSTTNPILVNDQTLGAPLLLHEGDHLKIGQTIFIYSEEPPPKLLEEPQEEAVETLYEEPNYEEPKIETELPKEPTIFEEKIEATPLSLLEKKGLILKVLAGPNSGAEFLLEKKTYIIGKDTSSDIVFNDLSVSKKHASLVVGDVITIEDLGSLNKTLVNGAIVEKKELLPEDVISLGTTSFVIVDQKEGRPTIFTEEKPKEELPPSKEEEKKPIFWKDQLIPKNHLIIGGVVLTILFIVFVTFFSLFKSHRIEKKEKNAVEQVEEALKKYEDVHFSFNPEGETLFLVGHVLTRADHEELKYNLSKLPFVQNVGDNVVIDEYVWKNTNDVLSETGWKTLSLYGAKAGSYILSGTLKSLDEKTKLSEFLNLNFPYMDRLRNEVVVEALLNAEIARTLIQHGFEGLGFQYAAKELILTGYYSQKRAKEYPNLLKRLKRLPGISTIKNLAISTAEQKVRIDLTQKYKVTGTVEKNGKLHSVIINGLFVSEGETLDGMTITGIKENQILLEKDEIKYRITLR